MAHSLVEMEERGGILLQCAFASLCTYTVALKEILMELTQNNDRFTAQHQAAGPHVADIKQRAGTR